VAFDFGLKTFLTDQNANEIESPLFFNESIKTIKKTNRNLKRKQKGSNNRKKSRVHLARIHKKIANKRKDFHFKLAKQLSLQYDVIFLETLDLNKMKKRFGRKISDLGFYSFLKILEYECTLSGCKVIYIDKWDPSSKTCSNCLWINNKLKLKDRKWDCSNCGSHHKRDHNAAKNIYRVGASTLKINFVKPSQRVEINNLRIQRL